MTGAVTPDMMCRATELASLAEPEMTPRFLMPPATSTVPVPRPTWMPVPGMLSNTPEPATEPSMIRP